MLQLFLRAPQKRVSTNIQSVASVVRASSVATAASSSTSSLHSCTAVATSSHSSKLTTPLQSSLHSRSFVTTRSLRAPRSSQDEEDEERDLDEGAPEEDLEYDEDEMAGYDMDEAELAEYARLSPSERVERARGEMTEAIAAGDDVQTERRRFLTVLDETVSEEEQETLPLNQREVIDQIIKEEMDSQGIAGSGDGGEYDADDWRSRLSQEDLQEEADIAADETPKETAQRHARIRKYLADVDSGKIDPEAEEDEEEHGLEEDFDEETPELLPTGAALRQFDEEFAGYMILVKRANNITTPEMEMEEDEDDDDKNETEMLQLNEEDARQHQWEESSPLDDPYKVDEFLYYEPEDGSDTLVYRVGGKETPPTIWQGQEWLTWKRTWENIRKNGVNPSVEEVEKFLRDVVGTPKASDLPVNPPRQPRPIEKLPTERLLGAGNKIDTSLLKSEQEWSQWMLKNNAPRTWFQEARLQYKRKLHLVRKRYLEEYNRIKALHEANIQARWDQQKQNKARSRARKARQAEIQAIRNLKIYQRYAERRRTIRQKTRFNRQCKDMKERRGHLHMLNYMIRERSLHWIQPKIDPVSKKVTHHPNLSTKLFEKQEFVEGFWPLPKEADSKERMDERRRRELAKML